MATPLLVQPAPARAPRLASGRDACLVTFFQVWQASHSALGLENLKVGPQKIPSFLLVRLLLGSKGSD